MDESRLCASCKTRPVAGKRKDAIYCTDPKCRKDAHLKRKEQAAQLPPTLSANKSSLIITFPDGRRCLIELTLLESVAPTPLLSLTQVPNTPTENESGSTLVQAEPISGIEGSGQIQTDQILHSLVQQTALPTSLQDAPDQIQNRLPESAPTSAPTRSLDSRTPIPRPHPQTSRILLLSQRLHRTQGEPKRASRPKCEPSNSTLWMNQEER
jgi:hypothetical protein